MKRSILCLFACVLAHCLPLRAQTTYKEWGRPVSTTPPLSVLQDIVSAAAGSYHVVALKSDGTLAAWGDPTAGNPNVTGIPAGVSDALAIAAGDYHSLALRADGTVIAWGGAPWGGNQPTPKVPAGLDGVKAIAAMGSESLALRADGRVVAWDYAGNLLHSVPAGLTGIVAISASRMHVLALKADGTVVAWGSNTGYAGTFAGQSIVPEALSSVVAVAAGTYHSLALKSDGTVIAWGSNSSPHSVTGQSTVPTNLSGVVAIAAGNFHSLALKSDGTVAAWGANSRNQCNVPAASGGVIAISAALDLSIAIMAQGSAPVIASSSPWVTEAGAARHGQSFFWKRIIASGSPTSFSVTGLPSGLTLDPSTGVISGTAVSVGVFPLVLTASNASGTDTSLVELTVSGSPFFITPPPQNLSLPCHQLSWVGTSLSATGLPPGALLDAATGLVSGLPPGQHAITLTASNVHGAATISWTPSVTPLHGFGLNSSGQTDLAGLQGIAAVSAGGRHSLILMADGTVIARGDNSSGQSTVPSGLSNVVAISAGGYRSTALKSDGRIVQWPPPGKFSEFAVIQGITDAVAIASGYAHSLALRADGTVVAWGENYDRQTEVPAGLSGVVAVAAGHYHSLALKADGSVVAWGRNHAGQVSVPEGLARVVAVSAGESHSLALKLDGTVVAWGRQTQETIPEGLADVVAISAGGTHSLALREDGSAVAWWDNSFGQATVPQELKGVVAISAGEGHSLALWGGSGVPSITSPRRWITEAAGARPGQVAFHQKIMATGNPQSYSVTGLPDGLTLDPGTGVISGAATEVGTFPLTVSASNPAGTGNASVVLTVTGAPFFPSLPAVSTGDVIRLQPVGTSYAVTGLPPHAIIDYARGEISGLTPGDYNFVLTVTNPYGSAVVPWAFTISPVMVWGDNSYGQAAPVALRSVVAISAGRRHCLALKADGTVALWGWNDYGSFVIDNFSGSVAISAGEDLGSLALKSDGTLAGRDAWSTSQLPSGLSDVVAVSAGSYHSLALKGDGSVVAWGNNSSGQTSVPSGLSGVIAVSAGEAHSLALRADGTVAAWGSNYRGERIVPPGLAGVRAISAGRSKSLAVKADGTVAAWGIHGSMPAGLREVVEVSAGYDHSLALKRDGTVSAWGQDWLGQSTVPAGLQDVVAVSAGNQFSMALIRPQSMPAAASVGIPYSMAYPAAVALAEFSASGMPPGLSIDPATGIISGIPEQPGGWRAVITMSNRAQSRTETQSFLVTAPASLQNWLALHFPGGGPDSLSGADPDGDGVSNAFEYVMNSDPQVPGGTLSVGSEMEPNGHFALTLEVPEARMVDIRAQFADDLSFSTRTGAVLPQVSPGAPPGMVRLRFSDPVRNGQRRFARLQQSLP